MRKSLVLAAATLLCTASTFAHEQNELFFRVGAASVQPDASSGAVLGGGVDVKNATNLGFTGTWFINKHWGVEVLAALPFEHDIVGSGALKGVDIDDNAFKSIEAIISSMTPAERETPEILNGKRRPPCIIGN